MQVKEPVAEIDSRYGDVGVTPTPWLEAREMLEKAEVFWISTVRPDGRPHVTPLVAVWCDGALYFSTGEEERKNRNILQNPHCILTTGCNAFKEGFDLVLEGDAVQLIDEAKLQQLADLWKSKYDWNWTVRDGKFHGDDGSPLVYEVRPVMAFGFSKGKFSQTRWRF